MINLPWISHVLDAMTMQGKLPAEIHMSEFTHKMFTAALIASGAPEPQPEKVGRRKVKVWRFRKIPLVVNSKIPDNGMFVRPANMMDDPNWMDKCLEEQRQMAEIQRKQVPMIHGSAAATPPQGDSELRSSEAFRPGIETPTDVLVGAATNCDDVDTAIVILVRNGRNEVEVRSNANRYEVQGVLQQAFARVVNEGM